MPAWRHAVEHVENCRIHGPKKQYPDGSVRCPQCRTAQRREQRERAEDRKAARVQRARNVEVILELDEAEWTDDDLRTLIEAGETIDFGDDYAHAARLGAPWVSVTDAERDEAAAYFRLGKAEEILARAGVSARAFGKMVGLSNASVSERLRSKKAPRRSKIDLPARVLLDLKMGNDEEDELLVAHGLEPSRQAAKAFDCPARTLAEPWIHCTGCKKVRQAHGRY